MGLTELQEEMLKGLICPYCKKPSVFVDSKAIYGKSYGMVYWCKPCDAWVGVHKGTKKALGRLANIHLRYWKKEAHSYFDKLWKSKQLKRGEAYKWLSEYLDIPIKYTHIGMFGPETCQKVVEGSKMLINDLNRLDKDLIGDDSFDSDGLKEYYDFLGIP